ncbi:uncharacterized protein DS421_14g456150 [Arachis hypogaea]|nr:uncharacterized protein DS421_14g456150 [Arachis hypogaea]
MFLANSCQLFVLLTMRQFFAFFATSKVLYFMAFIFLPIQLYPFRHTQILFGLVISLIFILLLVISCFLETLSFLSELRSKRPLLDQAEKLNTVLSLIPLLRFSRFVGFSQTWVLLSHP